jgi:DNA polymerase I-like protein with 3'-5' exonuclease and polymerase domains
MVHDELVIEAKLEQAERVALLVQEEMQIAASEQLIDVPVEVGISIAPFWNH